MAEETNLADVLQSLKSPIEGQPKAFRRVELEAATGYSKEKVLRILRKYQNQGRLDVVRIQRKDLRGRLFWTDGYMLVEGKDDGDK